MRARTLVLSALVVALAPACDRPPHHKVRETEKVAQDQEEHPAEDECMCRVSFGTVMADVARRFEQLGRAALAQRYEYAEYQRGEIDELFEHDLPTADPPGEGHPEVLPPFIEAFANTNLPELKQALDGGDSTAIAAAFERAAAACNECHRASGHGFIVVPLVMGQSVPDLLPKGQ